jgi:hypothetical protein
VVCLQCGQRLAISDGNPVDTGVVEGIEVVVEVMDLHDDFPAAARGRSGAVLSGPGIPACGRRNSRREPERPRREADV